MLCCPRGVQYTTEHGLEQPEIKLDFFEQGLDLDDIWTSLPKFYNVISVLLSTLQ